jgi:hypothetical protein
MKVSPSAAPVPIGAEASAMIVARAPAGAIHAVRVPADRANVPVGRAQVAVVVHALVAIAVRVLGAIVVRVQGVLGAPGDPAVRDVMTAVRGVMIVDSAAMIAGTISRQSSPRPCALIFCRSRQR